MAPIRTAIIGLSSSGYRTWAAGAHLPYLLSARGQSKYQIVALCNSSVEAARNAVKAYNLPAETRTYGNPQDLADDPDIDLVVNCTRVDVHHATILPSVKAGKSVFVEWPLAHNLEAVRELVSAARHSRSRTAVGVQGRLVPVVEKVRELLSQGRIGKVLSAEVRASGGTNDRDKLPSGLKYFIDRSIGGNVYTIGFAHLFDQVQHILGDLTNLRGQFQLQRPTVQLIDSSTRAIVGSTTSNVPDLFFATGSLAASAIAHEGASVLLRYRRGQPFPGDAPLVFSINGEKGEIRLTSPGAALLHTNGPSEPVTIEVHDFETDEVQSVNWEWVDWQEELPFSSRTVGLMYEAIAAGSEVPSFEDALVRHEQLDGLLTSWAKE